MHDKFVILPQVHSEILKLSLHLLSGSFDKNGTTGINCFRKSSHTYDMFHSIPASRLNTTNHIIRKVHKRPN